MKGYTSRRYAGIPLGIMIQRSLAKTWTFRIRKGNGVAGTRPGEIIQDKYPYTVSDPNADHVGIANKNDFAAAVAAWQALTGSVKAWWNSEAKRLRLTMSGYNLYIRRYRLGL